MPRRKPRTHIIADLKQAEAALSEIAEIERTITSHEAHMNETIDKAKADAKALCAPLVSRRKELADALATYATLHKTELFANRRSLDLGFGQIGFRKVTKLMTQPKITMASVLERLRDLNFTEAIRSKESVDKEAMREWPEERLATVGMRRMSSDDFFYEIDQEAVEDAA